MLARAIVRAMDELEREAARLRGLADRVEAVVWESPAGRDAKARIDGTIRDVGFVVGTYRKTGVLPGNPRRTLRAALVIRDWMGGMAHHCENLLALKVGVLPVLPRIPAAGVPVSAREADGEARGGTPRISALWRISLLTLRSLPAHWG